MAYVRKHGHRLKLVRGVRDPTTGKVQQQVLHSFASRGEAVAALGAPASRRCSIEFRRLIETRYRDVRVDWIAVKRDLRRHLSAVDAYEVAAADEPSRRAPRAFHMFARVLATAREPVLPDERSLLE